jgi:hypothetical protein
MSASGAYPHLILSSTGEETDFVDAALARHKMARRITLRVPLLAAPVRVKVFGCRQACETAHARTRGAAVMVYGDSEFCPVDVIPTPARDWRW